MKINEIFVSIQGESTLAGLPTLFVRTSGCNLRCFWCDTTYAYEEGKEMTISDIIDKTNRIQFVPFVCLTGGEPLLQKDLNELIVEFQSNGRKVSVETNGSLDIGSLPPKTKVVMDIKTPSSGMHKRMLWDNMFRLTKNDEVKFVIADRHDYEFAKKVMERYDIPGEWLMGPVWGRIPPKHLAKWILKDRLNVRLQLQLHKLIWGANVRGV